MPLPHMIQMRFPICNPGFITGRSPFVFLRALCLGVGILALPFVSSAAVENQPPQGRVVFLGDSITYAGEWVEFVETGLHLLRPDAEFDFIDLGLPSETVSG